MASDAFALFVEQLLMRAPTLWVVTPDATEGTALQKKGCPDARTVIDGIPLDVEEERRHGFEN